MKKRILLVDDEQEMINLLEKILQKDYMLISAENSEEALKKTHQLRPDLIILDLKLPTIGGLEVCRTLKEDKKTQFIPIIILTCKDTDIDKIIGLKTGADDYVTKPFNQEELVARVEAVLRRMAYKEKSKEILKSEDISIDIEKHKVLVKNKVIDLRPKEFDLLCLFAKSIANAFNCFNLFALRS